MLGLPVGHAQIFSTISYRFQAVAYRLPETLEQARYAVSRQRVPRLLVPFFQLFGWILLCLARLFARFLNFFVSAVVFYAAWTQCKQYYSQKLGGAWAPAFPTGRTNFVLTLAAIPIWGVSMAGLTLLWLLLSGTWTLMRARMPRRQRYEPLAVDLDDLEPVEGDDSERGRRTPHGSPRRMEKPRKPRGRFGSLVHWAVYLSAALFGVYLAATYEQPIDHRFKKAVELANKVPKPEGYGTGEKIFLAAMFYNNGGVLPYWITEVTKLIYYLGPENVFVSIVESNSWDNTAELLEEFDRKLETLGVARRILTHDTSIERPPSMDTAPPRIQFLAAVRNLVMQPLVEHGGYTRVVFSNDVFIEAESIVELLDTKGGDFDMACGLDLAYWGLYDQWVIRDRLGRIASTLWPYFLEDLGFRAVMADEPAPVFTCWNGIIAVRAEPFLPPALRTTTHLSTAPLGRPLPSTHPAYPQPADLSPARTSALRFRASAPDECFSSESFLLPYDLRRQFDMQDIYVNPRVINSYSWEYYVWWKYVTRHWAVKWWIETVENGAGIIFAKMILFDPARVWQWDGVECHPW